VSGRAAPDVPGAIAIRDALAGDLDRIAEIERASFADPWSRGSFASLLRNPQVYFRVAVARPAPAAPPPPVRGVTAVAGSLPGVGEVVGHVVGYVVAWLVVDEAEVANVAVAPEVRGRGIGARLLDDALDAARDRGAAVAYLEVRDSNAAARALYASRGFEQVGRRRNYYRKPVEDALVMRRELDPHARGTSS
jgi:ribosomal-protein-alanine N-acetyltransferase